MKSHQVLNIQKIVFLYVAGCLVLVAIFLNNPDISSIFKTPLKHESILVYPTKVVAHEFSYIKPFTALVRFHKKSNKEVETKNPEQKLSLLNFPTLNLKLF